MVVKGVVPPFTRPHDPVPAVEGSVRVFGTSAWPHAEDAAGRETFAGRRDASGGVADAVSVARGEGLLLPVRTGSTEADPDGAGRPTQPPTFRRAVVSVPTLAPVPGAPEVVHDTTQTGGDVPSHLPYAVGGPGDPAEAIADVLLPGVEVPQAVHPQVLGNAISRVNGPEGTRGHEHPARVR